MSKWQQLQSREQDLRSIPVIQAVLFDFDGTLTEPSLNLGEIKKTLGCSPDQTLLEYIEGLPTREEQDLAHKDLDDYEFEAAANAVPNAHAEELVGYLRSRSVPMGIISRNRLRSIQKALRNFKNITSSDFQLILTRDDDLEPKPNPQAILMTARKMGLETWEILTVGDFIYDVLAGQAAEVTTVFLTNSQEPPAFDPPPDYVIDHLGQLKDLVRYLLPLPAGKLPTDFLKEFLEENSVEDPSVLVNAGVGEDVAAVQPLDQDIIVLKTDPITFPTEQIGYYTVLINANDLATSGAVPRWLLTTLLLPVGYNAARIHLLMRELAHVSRAHEVSLCGGHTEVTDAVNKPVVVGQLVGTVASEDLIDKCRMKQGDQILLTKSIAVEGTGLLAKEFPQQLQLLGMSGSEIERCQELLFQPGISILKEAAIAAATKKVTAMHDVTEGGLATAFRELGAAGKHRLQVIVDDISILPETCRLCELLQLDALGLIGSGSLLIVCQQDSCQDLISRIDRAGIRVCRIGQVLEKGSGIEALRQGKSILWPEFEVDEVTRAIEKLNNTSSSEEAHHNESVP